MIVISIQNIQAIGSANIVIEEHSIVEFTGDNSNGKSVISKVIQAVTSGDITHKDVRYSLIKDGEEFGLIVFQHDGRQLGFKIDREMSQCLVMFKKDETSDMLFRPLNDKDGLAEFCYAFGFRTYASGDICLQLSPTWGAIPFITTSGSINQDIVDDITRDKIAETFLESFQSITYPIFKQRLQVLKSNIESHQSYIDKTEKYDWRAYQKLADEMRVIFDKIRAYNYAIIDDIPVPDLSVLPVDHFELTNIPIVEFYDYGDYIEDIDLSDYLKVMEGTCPTCGRPFVEHSERH